MSIVEHDRSTRFLFYYCSMTLWHSRFSLFLSHTLTYTHTLCPAILQEQVRKKKPPEAVCYRQAWNCAKPTVLARAEELYEAVFINYKFPCGLVAVRDGTAKQKKINKVKKLHSILTYIYIVIFEGFVSFVKHTALAYIMQTKEATNLFKKRCRQRASWFQTKVCPSHCNFSVVRCQKMPQLLRNC